MLLLPASAHALLVLLAYLACLACCAPSTAASSTVRRGNAPAQSAHSGAATTVAYWPREVGATLSHARDADGSVRVKTPGRGFFGTLSAALDASSTLGWVPPVQSSSSTFDLHFASSPQLFAVHSVGFHIQVTFTPDTTVRAFSNAATQDAIEVNVKQILHEVFPAEGSLPAFQRGFLAKSLCRSHNWRSAEPMREAFESDSTASLCYSSTFSFPSTPAEPALRASRLPAFSATGRSPNPETSSVSSVEQFFRRKMVEFEIEKRLTQVTIARGSGESALLAVEILEAWTVDEATTSLSWRPDESEAETMRLLVVSSIQHKISRPSFDYAIFQGGSTTTGSHFFAASNAKLFPTVANVSIVGEGFHRRVTIDVNVKDMYACDESTSKLLLRVPLSHEVYADLDELRRMERFGELRLLAFAKHIEIERPSPVSPQHTVALEFPMHSQGVHIEFPIHFRYQAPSENELYRRASVVAPDLFIYCPENRPAHPEAAVENEREVEIQASAHSQENIHNDIYIQTWLAASDHRSASGAVWQRVSLQYPVDVADVATPVGFLPSGPLVSLATFSVASIGALLLVFLAVASAGAGAGGKKQQSRKNVWTNGAAKWRPKAP